MIIEIFKQVNHYLNSPEATIVTFPVGFPELVPLASIFLITSTPLSTLPKTTCFPSK